MATSQNPSTGLNIVKPSDFVRKSEEFMTRELEFDRRHDGKFRGIDRIDFKHSKQSSINQQSPQDDGQSKQSPHHQFFNSTLNKSHKQRPSKNSNEIK